MQNVPAKLKTRCNHPGCPNTSHGRFCAEHTQGQRRTSDRRRGSAKQRGYDTTWSKVAAIRRNLDCGLCQPCVRDNRLTASSIVDHIIPLHVRPDWRLVLGNTQVICHVCHQQKTREDVIRYGSSTATRLTDSQRKNRRQAQELVVPARGEH
jgi:5-methylcytosine-specific restriction protein A